MSLKNKRLKVTIPKTLKALIVLFIAFYVIFVFEIIYLNQEETVDNYKINFQKHETCAVEKPLETEVAFFGDMMFDRFVWHSYKDEGLSSIFSDLNLEKFSDSDIIFANLEGPISSGPISDVWIDDSLIFNMPAETIDALEYIGVNGVSLANNHSLNAGESGFLTTQRLLDENRIKYAGHQNQFGQSSVVRFDGEIPVSIVAVSFVGNNFQNEVLDVVRQEASARFVVVFPHWGVEYSKNHNYTQEKLAHAWVDAGADLVIGAHPHVVQDVEIYKDVPVFYSLGNFIFDQMFSAETQKGLAVKVLIGGDYQKLEIIPFTSTKMKPKFDDGVNLKKYINDKYIEGNTIEIHRDWTN